MAIAHKFDYNWKLSTASFSKDKGKVFSCFACGGGSSMGYKLAGYDVIGCNEIDPRMNKCYVENHHPKYNFLCDIREMVKAQDLPEELYQLDILDGSPPCSTFCMSGSREKGWGKKKVFREGQAEQVMDTLFFDFIALAKKLQPKAVIAENVKGLILGSAKDYVRRIYDEFDKAGYHCLHFLLEAQSMGVPQRRPRVFFLCLRKDLSNPFLIQKDFFTMALNINMDFNEIPITYGEIEDHEKKEGVEYFTEHITEAWNGREEGDTLLSDACERLYHKRKLFDWMYCYRDKICPTLTAHKESTISFYEPRYLTKSEILKVASFPSDYDFCGQKPNYVCGMSVPPVMMAQVASRVWEQWLSKL